jgi:hypothetical protein
VLTCGEKLHTEAEAEDDEHDGCPCRYDIEAAAYWIAVDFHGGQWSELYSASCLSLYRPGPMECGPEAGSTEAELYEAAGEWIKSGG